MGKAKKPEKGSKVVSKTHLGTHSFYVRLWQWKKGDYSWGGKEVYIVVSGTRK